MAGLHQRDLGLTERLFPPAAVSQTPPASAVLRLHSTARGHDGHRRSMWAVLVLCVTALAWCLPSTATAREEITGLCRADALFVSDNPEAVRGTRGLFRADTGGAGCVRLLYHHENAAPSSRMAIQIWALDPDDSAVHLRFTLGAGGPTQDVMAAGHSAAVKFWQAVLANAAVPMDIAPHQWKPLLETVLEPRDVISGLAQVEITGGRLTLVVLAYLPGESEGDIAPASFLARVGTHPFGVFSAPLIEEHVEAKLDQPRGLQLAGGKFLVGRQPGEILKGNYGVVYHLRVSCVNASSRPVLLSLVFTPRHGPAAGTLVINGRLVEVPPLPLGARREVGRYRIPAGTWLFDIWTLPEGASAYPVRLDFLPAGNT